jgi:hypothetical protein
MSSFSPSVHEGRNVRVVEGLRPVPELHWGETGLQIQSDVGFEAVHRVLVTCKFPRSSGKIFLFRNYRTPAASERPRQNTSHPGALGPADIRHLPIGRAFS